MEKKYELLENDTIEINGRTLYRIKALRDIGDLLVYAGDIGGYIEKENNLSHEGSCWVFDNAKVYEDAKVYDDAEISDNAEIFGDAEISDRAMVYGNAKVFDIAYVYGDARVFDYAIVCGNAIIYGNTEVYDFAKIDGNAVICNSPYIGLSAKILDNNCIIKVEGFGRDSGRTTTFFKLDNGDIGVTCGCFAGTLKQFKKKVRKTYGFSKYGRAYLSIVKAVELQFKQNGVI